MSEALDALLDDNKALRYALEQARGGLVKTREDRDEWKARAEKAESAIKEAWDYCETTYWMRKDDTSHGPSMGTVIACEDVLVILRKHGHGATE